MKSSIPYMSKLVLVIIIASFICYPILKELNKKGLLIEVPNNKIAVEARSSSYNPQTNSIHVWFYIKERNDNGATDIFLTKDQDVHVVGKKIYDSLLVVKQDSTAYTFVSFKSR